MPPSIVRAVSMLQSSPTPEGPALPHHGPRDWMPHGVAEGCYADEGSARGSPTVASSPVSCWAVIAGRSSDRWPGCWPTGA